MFQETDRHTIAQRCGLCFGSVPNIKNRARVKFLFRCIYVLNSSKYAQCLFLTFDNTYNITSQKIKLKNENNVPIMIISNIRNNNSNNIESVPIVYIYAGCDEDKYVIKLYE